MEKWTKETIREKLDTDSRWLQRGVVAIWEQQTNDEQRAKSTRHDNGMGFNGVDAMFLSSIAERVQRGIPLSERQVEATRRVMRKYAGQLAKLANNKEAAE
jgi:hypothetical protein